MNLHGYHMGICYAACYLLLDIRRIYEPAASHVGRIIQRPLLLLFLSIFECFLGISEVCYFIFLTSGLKLAQYLIIGFNNCILGCK